MTSSLVAARASASAAENQRNGELAGYPKGALLIIGVEFWERFSFYGMLSILALFLTASPRDGGFGWPAAQSLALVGAYSGAMYALPAFGGFVADRVLGRRRAVTLGASLLLVGQIMLASPVFLPELLGWIHHAPLLAALHALDIPLGQIFPGTSLDTAFDRQGASLNAELGASWLRQAYASASFGFYAAIACLIAGNALMKSTLIVLCGETMQADDPRREAAYAYYYLGIAVGATLSGVTVGWVAQHFGWHFGFGVAAAGMTVALGCYVLLAPRWLGSIGLVPDRPAPDRPAPDRPSPTGATSPAASGGTGSTRHSETAQRIILLLVLAGFLCIFSVGWFQLFGSWLLFIDHHVDRAVGSFVIPVAWFTSMNAAVVILLAPLVAYLLRRLGALNVRIDILQKYTFALAMVTIGHVLMFRSALHTGTQTLAPLWLSVVALSLLGIGELVAWTATYGMVSRAAPQGYASVAMGAWYLLTLGLGGYLSGFTGRWVDAIGFAETFAIVAALMGAACIASAALRPSLRRLAARGGVGL